MCVCVCACVHDFLFADDCTLVAHSEEDLQCLADCFSTAVKVLRLETEVLCQSAPITTQLEPSIKIDGAALKNVEDFTHLADACPHPVALTPKFPVGCPRPAAHLGACVHEYGVSAVSPGQRRLLSTEL